MPKWIRIGSGLLQNLMAYNMHMEDKLQTVIHGHSQIQVVTKCQLSLHIVGSETSY